jgi:hypothetical protein
MLTEDGIRAAALDRMRALSESANASHRDHNDGVLRGLIWALTGSDPGTGIIGTGDTEGVLKLLGIPCVRRGGLVEYEMK